MTRFILLDIDGVLTSDAFSRLCHGRRKQPALFGMDWLDPSCLSALDAVIRTTGAEIIISSSWRELGMKRLQKVWKEYGIPGTLSGTTPEWILTKEDAIKAWIGEHISDTYIIIDDAPLPFRRLLRTNPATGLTMKDATTAAAMLLRESR